MSDLDLTAAAESDLDLTAAAEAATEAIVGDWAPQTTTTTVLLAMYRDFANSAVRAAAPIIERQVRTQIAAEIMHRFGDEDAAAVALGTAIPLPGQVTP